MIILKDRYYFFCSLFLLSLVLFGGNDIFLKLQKFIAIFLGFVVAFLCGVDKKYLSNFIIFSLLSFLSFFLKIEYLSEYGFFEFLIAYISMSTLYVFMMANFSLYIDWLVKAFIVLPLVYCFFSLVVYFVFHVPFIYQEYTGAYRLGGMLHPAHLAMLAYYSIACYVLMCLKRGFVNLYLLSFLFLVVVATGTRGAMIASFLIVLPIMKFYRYKYFFKFILIGIFPITIVLVYLILNLLTRNSAQLDGEAVNFSGRSFAWEYYLQLIPSFSLSGLGLGGSVGVTAGETIDNLEAFHTPHNEFIRFYVELGLIFGIIFFVNFFNILIKVHRFSNFRGVGMYFLLFLFSFFVYSFVDNTLSTLQSVVGLALFLKYYEYSRFGVEAGK